MAPHFGSMREDEQRPYANVRNPYSDADVLKVHKRVFPRKSIWPWIIGISAGIVLLCVGFLGVGLTISAGTLKAQANTVADSAKSYLSAAKNGDHELLKKSAASINDAAKSIQNELKAPVWEFSSRLPFIGSDVTSVRTLSNVLANFSETALVPMAQSGNILALKDFANDNSINFGALPGLINALDEVLPALNRTARTLESLPKANIPQLATALDEVTETVCTVDNFVTRIRPMFPYLPQLFGADGTTRNYLILAQNNAEIHAIGGFAGMVGVLKVTDGKIEMGDFQSLGTALSAYDDASGATSEEIATFGPRCDTHHGDHNVIPDFTRVGQLYFNIWNHYHDFELDGVVGVDPVFLQYLLGACGTVKTSYGITVDETNSAAVMLNQSLFWWKPDQCDKLYYEIANSVLSKLMGDLDGVDLPKFVKAITKAADEGRCIIWMHDEEAESAMKSAGFGGEIKHDVAKPELGVFISDASTSKMSFYLSNDIIVSEGHNNSDGSVTYEVSSKITNNFDPNARDVFPKYISVEAVGMQKRDDYDLVEEVRIVAPEGGDITDLTMERLDTRSGTPGDSDWTDKSYQGLKVKCADLRISAGESALIKFKVTTAKEADSELTVRKTPLMPESIAYWNKDISEGRSDWNIQKTV